MSETHEQTKKKLDTMLAFLNAGLNPEYAHINRAILEVVRKHYYEVYDKARELRSA